MSSRWIIAGLAAVLAVGASSVYAANSHGQAVSTLARTTTADGRAHGEAVSDLASSHALAVHAEASADASAKPEPEKSAPTTGCASARTDFSAFLSGQRSEDQAERQADRTEDQAEGAGVSAEDRSDAAEEQRESAADQTEDQAERAKAQAEDQSERAAFKAAVSAVVTACGDRDVESTEAEGAAAAEAVLDRVETAIEAED